MNLFKGFLIGFISGALLVGTSIGRTIEADKGRMWLTAGNTLVNSATYFFTVMFVAKDKYPEMVGSALGALLVSTYIAYRNKNKRRASV